MAANLAAKRTGFRQIYAEPVRRLTPSDLLISVSDGPRQTIAELSDLHDAQGVGGSNPLSPTTPGLRQPPQAGLRLASRADLWHRSSHTVHNIGRRPVTSRRRTSMAGAWTMVRPPPACCASIAIPTRVPSPEESMNSKPDESSSSVEAP
jgi:hypothetical protein